MNFTKIIRTTHRGELKETIVNVENIVAVKEKTLDPINLYDDNGDLVETRQPDQLYKVILRNGEYYNISKTEYDKLATTLGC